MALVQVKDAEGSVLDWMVGIAQSIPNLHVVKKQRWNCVYGMVLVEEGNFIDFPYKPSADWSQGGPIIEKLRGESNYSFLIENDGDEIYVLAWPTAHVMFKGRGETLLVAAMRCYVSSVLGEEVEVPDELI